MASSSSSLSGYSVNLFKPSRKHTNYSRQAFQVTASGRRDEGMWSSNDIVEAHMSVLKERIKELKVKEKAERRCRCENGWNYSSEYNYDFKRRRRVSEFYEVLGLVVGSLGFTCAGAVVFLYMVSLVIHLIHN